jgi:hypothetical protein
MGKYVRRQVISILWRQMLPPEMTQYPQRLIQPPSYNFSPPPLNLSLWYNEWALTNAYHYGIGDGGLDGRWLVGGIEGSQHSTQFV